MGTKELKDVLDLVLAGIEAGISIESDGKVDWMDIGAVIKLAPLIPPAVAGIDQIPSELEHLDPEQATELVAYVMAKLAVDDAKARNVIAASLKVLVAGYDVFKAVQA